MTEVPKKMEQAPQENAIASTEPEMKIDKSNEEPVEKIQSPEPTKGVLQQIEADLNAAASVPEAEDLRRGQLTMRAAEKGKVEEQRELQKAEKENKKQAQGKAKAKGRPRKVEGDGEERVAKLSRKRKQKDQAEDGDNEIDEVGPDASPKPKKKSKKKKAQTQEGELGTASPKAKAKAKAKRAPRARKIADPNHDPGMVQDMVDLMCKYHETPYDKTKETMHKVYVKGETRVWVSIYWNRPAGGLKIMDK